MLAILGMIALWVVGIYIVGFVATWVILTVGDSDSAENIVLAAVWPIVAWVFVLEILGV